MYSRNSVQSAIDISNQQTLSTAQLLQPSVAKLTGAGTSRKSGGGDDQNSSNGAPPPAPPASEAQAGDKSAIEVGMKLEAVDRQNPNLVCVATIAEIKRDIGGKIESLRIHFDDWGPEFDYWAEPTSSDLHPIGWMAQVGSKVDKYSPALQPPLHFDPDDEDEKFTWEAYLKDQNAKAVPSDFFTQEQKGGLAAGAEKTDSAKQDSSSPLLPPPPPVACEVARRVPAEAEKRDDSKQKDDAKQKSTGTLPSNNLSVIEAGMRLEAVDRENPQLVCVASIAEKGTGTMAGSIKIHFDGWTDAYDYWTEPSSPDLHPVGWMEQDGAATGQYGEHVQPPNGYDGTFSWAKYLGDKMLKPVPYVFFTAEQRGSVKPYNTESLLGRKDAELIPVTVRVSRVTDNRTAVSRVTDNRTAEATSRVTQEKKQTRDISMLRVGMRLEAVDRQNPSLTCVATIVEIKPEKCGSGGPIKIHFDGWGTDYDYWAEPDSPDLHPVGYQKHKGKALQEPHGYQKTFAWAAYLNAVGAQAVPLEFFTEEQKGGVQSIGPGSGATQAGDGDLNMLSVGMRLEAVDRKFPQLICVAAIVEIRRPKEGKVGDVLIHFDGWEKDYDYWARTDSTDLHPVGFCAASNKSLQAPNNYQKKFEWTDYLREVSARPAPYEFFTQEQRGGTPPDATRNACSEIGIPLAPPEKQSKDGASSSRGESELLHIQTSDGSRKPVGLQVVVGKSSSTKGGADKSWYDDDDVPPAFNYVTPREQYRRQTVNPPPSTLRTQRDNARNKNKNSKSCNIL